MSGAFVYILRCSDDKFYVGSTKKPVEARVYEHNCGVVDAWTKSRRPVTLVWSEHFNCMTEAFAAERQLKGWSRAKKRALISGDTGLLKILSRNRMYDPRPSSGSGRGRPILAPVIPHAEPNEA